MLFKFEQRRGPAQAPPHGAYLYCGVSLPTGLGCCLNGLLQRLPLGLAPAGQHHCSSGSMGVEVCWRYEGGPAVGRRKLGGVGGVNCNPVVWE